MRLTEKAESMLIRRNTHMRSLFIEYPRNEHPEVNASLSQVNPAEVKFNLPVINADARGIRLRLPSIASGFFDLKIQDGDHEYLQRIALQ